MNSERTLRHQLDLPATQVIRSNDFEVGFIMAPIKDSAREIHTICVVQEYQNRGSEPEVILLQSLQRVVRRRCRFT